MFNPTGTGLVYSTYLGGSDYEVGEGIAVDTSGNAYVTGYHGLERLSHDRWGLADDLNALYDVFVTELNPTGSDLVFSTYLGASNYDEGKGIAVDTSGNAYVSGLAG